MSFGLIYDIQMNKTLYILIAGVASSLALMAIYYAFKNPCGKSGPCRVDYGGLDCDKILALGVTGPEVCLLQEWINRLSDKCVPVNGRFGRRTEAALITIIDTNFTSLKEIEHPKNPC